jgi:hypothetical protein
VDRRQGADANSAGLDRYEIADWLVAKFLKPLGHDLRTPEGGQITESHIDETKGRAMEANDEFAEVPVGRDEYSPVPVGLGQDLFVVLGRADVGGPDNVPSLGAQPIDNRPCNAFVGKESHCHSTGKTDS